MLRNLALAAVLTGAAALAGCSHDQGPGAARAGLTPGSGFHYLDEGASAKLAYGQADSDDVSLMLQCAKGSRVVEVSDVVRSAGAATLTLASAGRRTDLAVEVRSGEGPALAVGRTPADGAALAAFRRSGRIEVAYAGLRYGVAARPNERAGVERFFAACERRS